MQKSTGLAAAITDALRAKIEALAATLDELFPALIVPSSAGAIDEPAGAYELSAGKPDFVRADDEGWV